MKLLKLQMGVIAFSFLFVTGCKKEIKTNSEISVDNVQMQSKTAVKPSTQKDRETKARLQKLLSSLPAGYEKKLEQRADLLVNDHLEYRDMVRRALHIIEPSSCNASTPVNQWLNQQLADWDSDMVTYLVIADMLKLPMYNALLFENSSANQYFGTKGQYTQKMTKTFKDLKRFWNIQSDNIVLAAMHGNILQDRSKLIRTYQAAYGMSANNAAAYADFVVAVLQEIPQFKNGAHPIFTFNSFAQSAFNLPPIGFIPNKIIMGDGIMEAFTNIGYDDVAPQAILAHEFGHHIQFQLGLFGSINSPEATRRTELMADAYAAYYLSHARGASMQWKRVKQFLQVFFNIGDCSFNSSTHHGTPTQRMAAAEWGYSVANNAQKQGHILTAQQFTALFEAQLPKLLAH